MQADIPVASPVRVGKRTGILLAARTSDGRRAVRFDDSPAVPEVVEEGKLVKHEESMIDTEPQAPEAAPPRQWIWKAPQPFIWAKYENKLVLDLSEDGVLTIHDRDKIKSVRYADEA